MNSSHSYDFPNSRENLIRRNKRKKVFIILIPLVIVISIIIAIVILILPSGTQKSIKILSDSTEAANLRLRLPRTVKPISYKINLIPYLDENESKNFTIDGKIWIKIICLNETTNITFHTKNITVNNQSVNITSISKNNNNTNIQVLNQVIDLEKDFYTLILGNSLKPGDEYMIYIEFQSQLRDDLTGFYRSSYMDKIKNKEIWLAVTQFEPTDARKAFPCFDEPDLKAQFQISLGRSKNMSTVSNMNILQTEPILEIPEWFWDHYENSPPMSTYLVAFFVSDFTYRETTFKNLKTGEIKHFKVWARNDAINQTKYAIEIGTKVITFFEDYFGIEYPLPKMDLIAVPDFSNGAMENWGMITFKESEILYDPDVTSLGSKDTIASTISHEIGHQWFGDLVTPLWWSNLWLNEGFATYLEYVGANYAEPTWKKFDFFINEEIHYVFLQDVLESSHSISVSVNDPNEINEIFDGISYDKGASLIRMMDHFLTHKTFQAGLKRYLEKWKYNNTNQRKLWDSLTEQGQFDGTLELNMTVGEIMDTWTLQTGFPVVNVNRNYGQGGNVKFIQEKFRLIKDYNLSENDTRKWWIPISYVTPTYNTNFSKTTPEFWISNTEKIKETKIFVKDNEWILVNTQETGYYRVNYDVKNWNMISNQLKSNFNTIITTNRAQIIDDAFNLARASQLSYEIILNLTSYLKNNEIEYLPWKAFFDGIHFISQMTMEDEEVHSSFKSYVGDLISNQYKLIGFENNEKESLMDNMHRSNIISWACYVNHSDCVQKSREYFAEWVSQTQSKLDEVNPVPLNLRKVIYCTVIRNGSEIIWDFLFQHYLLENVASAKKQMLQGLSCSRNKTILEKFVNMTLTPESGILKQDAETILKEIAKNPIGASIVFNILSTQWEFVESYVGPFLGNVLRVIGDLFSTRQQLLQLLEFKKINKDNLGTSTRALDELIEKVQNNMDWVSKRLNKFAKFLSLNNV